MKRLSHCRQRHYFLHSHKSTTMYQKLTWLCYIYILSHFTGIASTEKTKCDGTCCANYILQGEECVPCEMGTYGVNCTQRCKKYFHGRFCKERCACDVGDCDPRTGRCYYDSTSHTTMEKEMITTSGISTPLVISLFGAGSIIIFIGITGCTVAIKRRNPSGNSNADLLGMLELLSRSLQSSPVQNDQTNRNSFSNSNSNADDDSNAVGAYNYIDSNDIISSFTLDTGKQESSNGNLSSIVQTARNYHKNTVTDEYCTLTRLGKPPTAEVPKSSSVLNRAITDWNNEKPEDYIRVRKWQEVQKGKKPKNDIYKAEKRRRSKTMSYIRRGINSIFRNSRSGFDLHDIKDDVNTSNLNRYSLVKPFEENHQSQSELEFTQVNEQSSEDLPPPPDEWYAERKLSVSENEGSQGSLIRLNDENQENYLQSATTVTQPEANDNRKHGNPKFTLQKCHITQKASYL